MVKHASYIFEIISVRSVRKGPWPYILSEFSFRNSGSVWELYLLHVMIRTARFCSLSNRPILNPHAKIEYCRCGRIKELYKTQRMCIGRKFFRRHIIPRVRAILFEIFCMCGFQLRCSTIVSPRKLNSLTFFIFSEFIFKVGMILFIFRW